MKPIWIATAVLTATLALTGCKNRKEEPIPGPNAGPPTASAPAPSPAPPSNTSATPGGHDAGDHHGASGIYWFQGTLEEAFSTTCHKCASMFRH